MSKEMHTRVLVAHRNPVIGAGVSALLAEEPGLLLTRTDASQIGQTSFSNVDVLVGDYDTIIAFMTRLRGQSDYPASAPRLMIVTAQEREWEVRQALDLGVHAYVLTDCQRHELVSGVLALQRGNRYVCDSVSQRLVDSLSRVSLTRRELDVLGVMAQGACNKAIATMLGISVGTAKSHVAAILGKLQATTRTEAAAIAQARGLLAPPTMPPQTLNPIIRRERQDTALAA
ncbi:response regulator transcription factor [Amantichitinum ursilacus]|uniref:Transcriptional regulatory protein DegU n=1 Tax=Amantichitinum ursilacus TaxID=857265 RepID=A0A0N0XKR8_9NEIS|nr:response regulator transcription factor [Amantichitinum ursilacus]KPC54467.1 Transcriptional regulatory protein DegU [Amantichitinum ursilacus]